jgi:hypothetical protein
VGYGIVVTRPSLPVSGVGAEVCRCHCRYPAMLVSGSSGIGAVPVPVGSSGAECLSVDYSLLLV